MERCRGKSSLQVPKESNSTKKRSFKKSDFDESSPTLQPAIRSCESGQRMPLLKAAN